MCKEIMSDKADMVKLMNEWHEQKNNGRSLNTQKTLTSTVS